MAGTELTLENIRGVVSEEIDLKLGDVRGIVRDEIEVAEKRIKTGLRADIANLGTELRTEMVKLKEEITEDVGNMFTTKIGHITEDFDKVNTRLDRIENDVVEIKREVKGAHKLVDQHSKDIMELRAKTA
jgi:uncharacterized coiled-coil DUF342 family protein